MKRIIISLAIVLLVAALMGCSPQAMEKNDPTEMNEMAADTPAPEPATKTPQAPSEPTASAVPQTSVPPKLTGEATNAPTKEDVEETFGVAVSTVILKDTLEYELPLKKPFAVVLSESTTEGMRWLLISEDGKYKFIQEMPMDGYRAFLFEPTQKGEDYVVFELVQGGSASIETLSFQLFLGVTAGGH